MTTQNDPLFQDRENDLNMKERNSLILFSFSRRSGHLGTGVGMGTGKEGSFSFIPDLTVAGEFRDSCHSPSQVLRGQHPLCLKQGGQQGQKLLLLCAFPGTACHGAGGAPDLANKLKAH